MKNVHASRRLFSATAVHRFKTTRKRSPQTSAVTAAAADISDAVNSVDLDRIMHLSRLFVCLSVCPSDFSLVFTKVR